MYKPRRARGKKIRRSTSLYGVRRSRFRKILTVVLMLALASGLIFLGYSVGAPILEFFQQQESSSVSDPPWSPGDLDVSASELEESSSVPEDGVSVGESLIESPQTSSNEAPGNPDFSLKGYTAYKITGAQMTNIAALEQALDNIKAAGGTAAVLPLKLQGGKLTYKSAVELAVQAGASQDSGLTAAQLCQIVTGKGLLPIAEVNVLYDNIVPLQDKTTGYRFENSGSSWYDNAVNAGGKPWISPFSDTARAYCADLAAEIYSAGFVQINCTDIIFPPFRSSDLSYIGALVKDSNRYRALLEVLQVFQKNAQDTKRSLAVTVSLKDAAEGTAEVFHPEQMDGMAIVAVFSQSELGDSLTIQGTEFNLTGVSVYDRVTDLLTRIRQKAPDQMIIPSIVRNGLTQAELTDALQAVRDMGYDTVLMES